jgi:DNA-binding NtrC family response regulator
MKRLPRHPASKVDVDPIGASRQAAAMEERLQRLLETQALCKLVGEAPAFITAIGHIAAAARSEATVLISGETGTGKELFARAIHYTGKRASFPFVPVNCGALADTLLEDELFGHERGAYTDARAGRPGLIAHAEKGTIFLDEVDALSLKAQVAVLRVLQDKRFRALGSSTERQADIRIVAATNADLLKRVRDGAFRPDLYFRLGILTIHLPSLRERSADILPLAAHFLKKHSRTDRPLRFADDACQAMMCCDWPGNVRQLENAVIRGCELCEGDCLGVDDLGLNLEIDNSGTSPSRFQSGDRPDTQSFHAAKQEVIATFEKGYLTRVIAKHAGNVSQAAREAQKERREFGKLLKKHHINPRLFDPSGQSVTLPLRDSQCDASRPRAQRSRMPIARSAFARGGCELPQAGGGTPTPETRDAGCDAG